SVEPNPVHVFENTSFTDDAVFDVWLYTQSAYHCRDSTNATIRVYPRVKADFVVDINQGCSPFVVTIENLSQGAENLQWNFGDGHTSTSADDILTHIFVNTTDTVQMFEIELLALNERGCTDTLRRVITVFPEVNAAFDHVVQGCHPLEVDFENLTHNADYYHWDFGDDITDNEHSPTHTFLNNSHYDQAVSGIELYATSIYGCFDIASSSIVVDPKPDASFMIENSPGCSPHELMILHNSQGGTSFLWDFDDNSPLQTYHQDTIYHLYNQPPGDGPAHFNITLIAENDFGCLDTLQQQAVVFPGITAQMQASVVEGCHPLTVEFTNASVGADAADAYFWNYGNGFTSHTSMTEHTHTFNNFSHTRDTVFTVMLTAYNENGCLDTTTVDIRVLPRPRAFFSVPNTPGCAPHDAIIHNFSVGADQLLWDMGDGNTFTHNQAHFSHGYTQPANEGPEIFTISLTVDNAFGCSQSHSQDIVIYPEIHSEFVTDNMGCHPHTASFENLSEGGDIILWTFGNGNFSQNNNPQQTFTNYSHTESHTYQVQLQVESTWGCSAQTSQEITVWPVPKPLFELSPFTGCSPFTPLVSNLSEGGTGYHWDLGNTELETEEPSFYHTWTNTSEDPMQYPVSLTVWNDHGCVATNNQVTTVYPEITAAFSTENDIWQGCSPLTIRFVNESSLSESYQWDFADESTSTSASPEHIFENELIDDHIFPVRLVAGSVYGCKDTVMHNVTVFPSPIADFSAQPEKQPYPNTTVTFTNQTNPGYWDYQWEFGDGNSHQTSSTLPFDHSYLWDEFDMSTKEYVVALHAYSEHCSDMITKTVTITSPIPKADFNSLNAGCAPFTIQFSNESMFAHSFRWEFGDGGYSIDPAPEYTFVDPGTYEVLLIAIGDGGRDTTYHHVEVHENPTALFELVSSHINIPEEPLRVNNNSVLADFYFWDFGDGNTSYEFEPEHYYSEPGIYNVTLVATSNTIPLCHDTLTLKNAPRVDESCRIIFPDAFMPEVSGSPGGSFDMSNPSTSVFHPIWEGVEDYALEIYNRWGELIFRSDDINEGWDGYVEGRLAKMDVYVWKVTGQCTTGKSIIMSGDVTLYR
ncbi:MAG: PKD domain-containing protein, partial [Bacteroidota bacterium]